MISEAHKMEMLSRAYIQAISGNAGLNVRINQEELDYGIDGTFHKMIQINNKITENGFPLDFQAKATVNWELDETKTNIVYKLEADAYNKLVYRNNQNGSVPIILILFCLPSDKNLWLENNEDNLILRKCCYWDRLNGELTNNKKTVSIKISRNNILTSQNLTTLLVGLEEGVWP